MSSIPWPSLRIPGLRFFAGLQASVGRRIQRWARKRQGIDPTTTVLTPGRVYILPTGVGMIYGLMAFAMLLGRLEFFAILVLLTPGFWRR